MNDSITDEARVNLGSKLLDQINPGWDRGIDLDILDIANYARCVLCQVYGTYREGLRQLEHEEDTHHALTNLDGARYDWVQRVKRCGFAVDDSTENLVLTAAWKGLIRARRPPPSPVAPAPGA